MSLALLDYDTTIQESIFDAENLIERFITGIDVKIYSRETYRRQIKPFIESILNKYSLETLRFLDQEDIHCYKESLIRSGKSSYTVSGYITVVRKFFAWLESKKIFPNIAKNIKGLKKPKGFRKDCLTLEQIRTALASFDTNTTEGLRDYALFNLLIRTGLRTVEVCRATVSDLRQESGEAILQVQGKGRDSKDGFVLLVDETLRPLRKYLASRGALSEKDPLFSSTSNRTSGEPLKERTISWIIKEALRKIDIDDSRITAHSLRHAAVSLSIKNGASLIQAQAMARHSDPKTTMIYFHNHERIKSGAGRFIII
jgi:integrase/recombinase XerC/integrase/recombinase XerD